MKELNLTQGSVPKVLLQFAVPFLIANVLQALYGGADLFVVGQYDYRYHPWHYNGDNRADCYCHRSKG